MRKKNAAAAAAAAEEAGDDRLSALPDDICLHILSFLPSHHAVRTGALSSRWRGLWHLRLTKPALIKLSVHASPSACYCVAESLMDDLHELIRLFSRNPPAAGRGYESYITDRLLFAAAFRVEDVRLSISPPPYLCHLDRHEYSVAFDSVCDCTNLVRLSLSGMHLSVPSHHNRHSSLEVLSLHGADLRKATLKNLYFTCPLLRSLDLRSCFDHGRKTAIIAGINLTSLTIVDLRSAKIKISAPGLRRLTFSGNKLSDYSFENFARLEEVHISSGSLASGLPLRSHFIGLSNTRVLTLCDRSLQNIALAGAGGSRQFRNFKNLKEMQLLMGRMTDDNLNAIYSFFRQCKCPRLEKLFVKLQTINPSDPPNRKKPVAVLEEPPEVYFESLKIIKINGFSGQKNEMSLVRFLLREAASLESLMAIPSEGFVSKEFTKKSSDDHSDFLDFLDWELSFFEKASGKAQILFSDLKDPKFIPTHLEEL